MLESITCFFPELLININQYADNQLSINNFGAFGVCGVGQWDTLPFLPPGGGLPVTRHVPIPSHLPGTFGRPPDLLSVCQHTSTIENTTIIAHSTPGYVV